LDQHRKLPARVCFGESALCSFEAGQALTTRAVQRGAREQRFGQRGAGTWQERLCFEQLCFGALCALHARPQGRAACQRSRAFDGRERIKLGQLLHARFGGVVFAAFEQHLGAAEQAKRERPRLIDATCGLRHALGQRKRVLEVAEQLCRQQPICQHARCVALASQAQETARAFAQVA
jgi:hypothetical protein